jgi:antitoxin component YwqK of YwqJK toxin-antitoxin module
MGLFKKLPRRKDNDKMKETDNTLHIVEIPYETGELKFRYTRKLSPDGTKWIREGLFQQYHKKGNLASEGNYLNGNEIGQWYFYDEYGELKDEENYD